MSRPSASSPSVGAQAPSLSQRGTRNGELTSAVACALDEIQRSPHVAGVTILCTIERFRARHEIAIGELFGQVLALCAKADLVRVGLVAVDGTKIAANATHHATRSYEQSRARFSKKRPSSTPLRPSCMGTRAAMSCRSSSGSRAIGASGREAKQALDAEREADAAPVSRDRGQRLRECRHRLQQDYELERRLIAEHDVWLAAGIASDGSRRMTGARHNIKPYEMVELPDRTINVTDHDPDRRVHVASPTPDHDAAAQASGAHPQHAHLGESRQGAGNEPPRRRWRRRADRRRHVRAWHSMVARRAARRPLR